MVNKNEYIFCLIKILCKVPKQREK